MAKQPTDLELEAIEIVRREKATWETTVVFVTDRVAIDIRNLIRLVRKNYYSIFDVPTDPTTGRRKIFVPLTESLVESVVKNIDLDTKDITFSAKKSGKERLAAFVRSIARNELEKIDFGKKLDDMERRLAIDGTAVWKTIEYTEGKEKCVKVIPVDLLNIYIDPAAYSIQDAYRFTERALLTQDEIEGMTGWINTKGLSYTTSLHPTDANLAISVSTTNARDVWEMWGKIPGRLITGDKDDTSEVDGHIIVSGINSNSTVCHLIEKNTRGIKPYEEFWYTRVPGRWHGRGVGEKIMMLQNWINTIVNIRINRSYVSQLGLFTIRRGSGITPQMIRGLASNGAILVQSQDDIQQLAMTEASQSSYTDEQTAVNWARMVTSAYEAVTGENMPASTTATIGAIQSRNAASQFVLIKEGVGMSLQSWLKHHFLPAVFKNVKRGDIVKHYPEFLAEYDQAIADQVIDEKLDEYNSNNVFITPERVELEREKLLEQLKRKGDYRFVELDEELDITEYDVAIDITNEETDKGVLMQNLITLLPAAAEYRQDILTQLFDLMGLRPPKAQAPQMMPPTGAGPQDMTQQMTQANTAMMGGQSPMGKTPTQMSNPTMNG